MMKTIKLYDTDAYATEFEANVISCEEIKIIDKAGVEKIVYEVILDQTLFFPEEGGQTPDKGVLEEHEVVDVQIHKDIITHFVDQPLEIGRRIKGSIDWKHRFFNMQQHSGEHLFSGLAHRKYGLRNVGFHLSNQIVTMDFDKALTEKELKEMEWEINEAIVANVEIKTGYPSKEKLAELEYRSKIEIDGPVRIVEIPGYDICACCAPHVSRTGEVGVVKILSYIPYKKGTRIEMICGALALNDYMNLHTTNKVIMNMLSAKRFEIADSVERIQTELGNARAENKKLSGELAMLKMEKHIADNKVCVFIDGASYDELRNCSNTLIEEHEYCYLFSNTDDNNYIYVVSSKENSVRELVQNLNKTFNGKGGGRDTYAQGKITATKEEILNFITK